MRCNMRTKKITLEHAETLIKSSNGSIFSVCFVKADGTLRDMVCRTGVSKHVKGVGMAYEPKEYGLVTVFDVQKKAYRMIRLETLRRVTMDGETFAVIQ